MSIANRLYDVPHGTSGAVNASDLPALYIDGSFKNAILGYVYEGRIQIHNAVGACTVKLLSGDLPNGSTLTCDNTTSEVVLRWPSANTAGTTVPNSGFGNGDDGTWERGNGWSIVNLVNADGTVTGDPDDPDNPYVAQYYNQSGESDIISTYRALVSGASSIKASCDVVQGKTSSNQAGAGVRIVFEDAVGNRVGVATGNIVENSDEPTNEGWKVSSVSAPIPSGAVYARLGASAFRNHQNRALWIDNLSWDLDQPSFGTTEAGTINLSLEVKDSTGRTAEWTGSVVVMLPTQIFTTGSRVIRSQDNFNTFTNVAFNSLSSIMWHKGKFVGLQTLKPTTNELTAYSSPDGITWTQEGIMTAGDTSRGLSFYGAVSTPTALLVLDNWTGIYRSTDGGKTWVLSFASNNTWADGVFHYTAGLAIAGTSGLADRVVYTFDDGVTWKTFHTSVDTPVGLVFVNGVYMYASNTGTVMKYNPDTDTWTSIGASLPGSNQLTMFGQIGDRIYFSRASSGQNFYSTTDFITYTNESSKGSGITHIATSPDGVSMIGNPNEVYVLEDGVWVDRNVGLEPADNSNFVFTQ